MSVASSDTYEVIFEVRDSPMAAGIEKMVADARRLDAQWTSSMNNMRQRTAALADGAGDSVKKIPSLFDGVKKSVGDATSEIGRMAVGFAVFTVGRQLITGMRDSLVDLRQYTVSMNKELTDMQLSLAEVQSITGRAGAGGAKVLQEHLDLMKYTGMTSQQATEFAGEYSGQSEVYRGRYAPGDFARIQQQSARFAMIHGGEAESHAVLTGRLLGYAPEGQRTADDIMTRQANLYQIMNLAPGRTAAINASYVQALSKLVSPTGQGGSVGSPEALAALAVPGTSVAKSPSALATTLIQFSRAVTGGSRSKGWNAFLRGSQEEGGLGIKEGTYAEDAMKIVFDRMQQEADKGRNLQAWLAEKGLAQSDERITLEGMFNKRSLYDVARSLKPITTAEAARTLEDPYTMGREGFRPELAIRRNEAAEKAVQLEDAQRNQMAEVFRGQARTQLQQRHEIGPQWEAGLGPAERAAYKLQESITGPGSVVNQKIDELALQLAKGQLGGMPRGEAEFIRQESSAMGRAKYMIPGYSATHEGKYAGFGYAQSNQLSSDINEMMTARRFGYDPATGAATGRATVDAGTKDTKILKDIADGVRKDRPMTVAKPAPSPRP